MFFLAVERELKEETGLGGEVHRISLGKNPDTPNVTFVCLIKNPKGNARTTYETEGDSYRYRKDILFRGLGMVKKFFSKQRADVFREWGIEISDSWRMAPNVCEGIRGLLPMFLVFRSGKIVRAFSCQKALFGIE